MNRKRETVFAFIEHNCVKRAGNSKFENQIFLFQFRKEGRRKGLYETQVERQKTQLFQAKNSGQNGKKLRSKVEKLRSKVEKLRFPGFPKSTKTEKV